MGILAAPKSFFQNRESAAQLGTVVTGLLILLASQAVVMQEDMPPHEETISFTTFTPPDPAQAVAAPAQIVRSLQSKSVSTPSREIVAIQEALVEQPVLASPAQLVAQVETVKALEMTPQSNGVVEGLFAQDVRNRIERQKIYPDRARDLGMAGEVEILYELNRSGDLIGAEISSSSGYKLLDQAALSAVKKATYKNFPVDAWLGIGSKVFRTKLVFSINQ